VQTVAPYAETTGREIETRRRLSEEHATTKGIEKVVDDLFDDDRGTVVCSHRPVLPQVYDALGLRGAGRGGELEPAEMLVLHVRKRNVVAVERHRTG
jgi:8-oxo-dGTP diphosphatase